MGKWDRGGLLKLSGAYWGVCALHAGVELGVFTAIGGRRASAGRLSRELRADRRGLETLLDALAAMGLLRKSGSLYGNSPGAKKHLSKDSPDYIGYMILHHHHLVGSWAEMARAVRSGRPVRDSFRADAAHREAFLMGMFNSAMNYGPMIVPKIDLSGRRHLLDLGGGPGTYACLFCGRHPKLRATVFDLPTTRPYARRTLDRFGLKGRVRFVPGDYLKDGLRGPYDAAWLSHILHAEGPETCRRIIEKTVAALEPGGLILIHEFLLRDTMDGPVFPALFSLNMLLGTRSGRSYSEGQVRRMLAAAGVRNIRRIRVSTPNDSGVLAGVK